VSFNLHAFIFGRKFNNSLSEERELRISWFIIIVLPQQAYRYGVIPIILFVSYFDYGGGGRCAQGSGWET